MDCRQFNESQDFSSYDYPMYQLDPYNSGSSVASSPHLCSPSPQYLDFDLSYGPFDFMAFSAMEPGECSQSNETPIGIAPQELHSPGFLHHSLLLSGGEETALTQETFATPRAVVDPTLPAVPEPPHAPTPPPNAFPMKRDRARGSANLYRSSKDPERQNGCTMCIRKFKRRADLARHLKRHQGIRPYECLAKSCPLSPTERFFFRADARQRHWKAHPSCEAEFCLTEAGIEWMKKNRNRSQKRRGPGRRSTSDSRDSSLEAMSDCNDDDDDGDYHD